jgi:polysaccharide pyruvyl transferase WcaK-like protein
MINYLIVGASLRSKGAEAMILETYNKIKEIDPANSIYLSVSDFEYNTKVLKKMSESPEIWVLQQKEPVMVHNKYLNFGLKKSLSCFDFMKAIFYRVTKRNSNNHVFYTNSYKEINGADIIIQIAGISFTDNFGVLSAFFWAKQMIVANLLGKKYYCMPQSFGPSNNPLIRVCAKIGLENVTHIMPRGKKSVKFIQRLHLKNHNITFVPDLAFSYENPNILDDEKIYHQFGLSKEKNYFCVLFNSHLYKWKETEIINLVACEIDQLISIYNYNVILIAHEIDEIHPIDDRYMNTLIFARCQHKDKIIVINEDLRANEIKSLIKLCDFTVCSRFHGMISSLKVGVPPIVIGWADKYFEIMELFDLEYLVLDYRVISIDMLHEKIEQVIQHKGELKRGINQRMPDYEKSSEFVKKILEG